MMNLLDLPLYPYDWWSRIGMDYPVVCITLLFGIFAFGACLGSFLNVCIWRIPRGESIVTAPSHCTTCGADIHWYDNLPIISYIVLRGKCRHCHTHYTCRYVIVESITALLFVAVAVKAGLAQQMPQVLPLYWWTILLSISCAWIDAEHRIIPDALTYPAIGYGILMHTLLPGACGAISPWAGLIYSALSAALPALMLSLFTIIGRKIARRDVLGWGDVKFAAACGALLGIPGVLFVLVFGSLAGSLYGSVAAILRNRRMSRFAFAFGPFLAAGAVIWCLAGNWIWHAYLLLPRFFR